MALKNLILSIVCLLTLLGCNQIKRKGTEVINTTKEQVKNKKAVAIDKVIPTFDSYKADTKFNKKRFEEFFGFPPTSDVNNIYCYGDLLGIDSKFLFSFNCDPLTKSRIINYLNLKPSDNPDNFSTGLWENFTWWDSAKIVNLNPHIYKSENKYYKYLWYDIEKKKVYYIDFDM